MASSEQAQSILGHELWGTGPLPVIVLNDWMCDTSSWDSARPYLDVERFTWVFTDLRGYGRSRGRSGRFNVNEAASDVLALADAKEWKRFAVIGHSMSSLVALYLAQNHADRIARTIVITPPPPEGFNAGDAALEATRALALADDETRTAALAQRFGQRLPPGWTSFKAKRWRATSDAEAVAAYAAMFMRDGLPEPKKRIPAAVLAITGEHDVEPMRSQAVARTLSPLCDRLRIVPFAESGHYPMQETPPQLVSHLERFLGADERS